MALEMGSEPVLEVASAWATAVPLTISAWFRDESPSEVLAEVSDGTVNNAFRLWVNASGNVGATQIQSGTQRGDSQSISGSGWHHGVAIFSSTTSSTAISDGTGSAASHTATTPGGLNQSSIANSGAGTLQLGGRIAEVAVWSVALTTAEVVALYRGRSPMTIRPASLVAYYPLGGLHGRHVRDVWRSSLDMSLLSGSLTYYEHPRAIHIPAFGGQTVTYTAPAVKYFILGSRSRVIGGGV